jgi:hypothetical protein
MILNIPLIADLELLRQRRQALIDQQLIRYNRRRISHDYQPNDEVQILTDKPYKLDPRASAPFAPMRMALLQFSALRSLLNESTFVDFDPTHAESFQTTGFHPFF